MITARAKKKGSLWSIKSLHNILSPISYFEMDLFSCENYKEQQKKKFSRPEHQQIDPKIIFSYGSGNKWHLTFIYSS